MLARTKTFTIEGLQTRQVIVEVDIRAGLPAFTIVGLADHASLLKIMRRHRISRD